MRKSFTEYITALGHWGWIVLVDIFSGISGAYLDVSDTWGFPTWLWIILLGIALVLVPFIAFHRLRIKRDDIQGTLDSIKNAMPEIIVEPKVRDNCAYLEVRNTGTEAVFSANARIVEGIKQTEWYSMHWVSWEKIQRPINKDEPVLIEVAIISSETLENDGIYQGGIGLIRTGDKGREVFGASTLEVIEDQKYRETYPVSYPQMIKNKEIVGDKCVIAITITSTPQLKEQFGIRKFSISIDRSGNRKDNKLDFSEICNTSESNLDKKGSLSK